MTYKETHYDAPVEPQDPPTWTGSWMDPRFSPPGDGGNPQNALTGQLFDANSGSTDITVPSQYSKLRFWRNTRVANLSPGQQTSLAGGSNDLGYEWDVDADNGFRPPGADGSVLHHFHQCRSLHRLRQHNSAEQHRHSSPDFVPCRERRPGVWRRDRAMGVWPGPGA